MRIGSFFEKLKKKREEAAYVSGALSAEREQQGATERIQDVSTKEAVLRKKIEALEAEKRVKDLERKHRELKTAHIRKLGEQFVSLGVKTKKHYGLAVQRRKVGFAPSPISRPKRNVYYVKKGKGYIKKFAPIKKSQASPVIKSSEAPGIKRPSAPNPFVEKSMITGKPLKYNDVWS